MVLSIAEIASISKPHDRRKQANIGKSAATRQKWLRIEVQSTRL
jgi:hypothetical protein